MSHQQPVIDGFEFASAGASKLGDWPLRDLPRLRDMLAADAGEVRYAIEGVRDERGRAALRVQVSGTLQLRCQRCLEAMAYEVQTDETLVLAGSLAEIHAEPASQRHLHGDRDHEELRGVGSESRIERIRHVVDAAAYRVLRLQWGGDRESCGERGRGE